MRDFADIYTQCGPRAVGVYISKIHDTSDIYHSEHTHLIDEGTTEHSPHLFHTLSSDDRMWF